MGFLVLDDDYEDQIQTKIQASLLSDSVLRQAFQYDITMPLLTNPPENRLACHETSQETAYVSAHISSRIRALYSQLASLVATNSSMSVEPRGMALKIW